MKIIPMFKTITLISSLISVISFTQEWAEIGTQWHYNYTGTSYSTFESTGDTLISGKLCRKIEKSKPYDFWGSRPMTEFTYYSNDSVYFYDLNYPGFHLLYDFGANPGEYWFYQFPGESYVGDIDSIKTTVDSVDYVTINGYSLRRLFVHYDTIGFEFGDDYYLPTSSTIIEFLGDTLNLFSTFTMDETIFDTEFPYGLRCFEDPTIGFYPTGIVDSCTWTNSLENENLEANSIIIYPNPTTGTITVTFPQETNGDFYLFNVQGKELMHINLVPEQQIDLNALNPGIYFYQIYSTSGVYSGQLIME